MPPITGVAPGYVNFPEVSEGAKGQTVSDIQTLLNQAGAKLKVDGDWGPKTDKAVRDFQSKQGLATDGIVGPKTMTALMSGASAKAEATARTASAAGDRMNLDHELSSPDSRLSVAIGNAEGTRNADGTTRAAYHGHTDPGNQKSNCGTFSKQDGPTNPKQADQAQLRAFRNFRPQYEQACATAHLDPSDPLLAASTFDLYNQSPAAVMEPGGFLSKFKELHDKGVTPESVVNARIQSFYKPGADKPTVSEVLAGPGKLKADQLRRTTAIEEVLNRPATKAAESVGKANGSSEAKTVAMAHAKDQIVLNSTGPQVGQLKQALKDAGFYDGPVNETMGHQGMEALNLATKTLGLSGPADSQTIQKIAQYAKSSNHHVEVDFVSQFDPKVPGDYPGQRSGLKCDNACQYMMEHNKSGKRVTPGDSSAYEHNFKAGGMADTQIQYMESQLKKGLPVMIGVNHPNGTQGTGNPNGTNHYLVATGIHSDAKGRYISYNNPVRQPGEEVRGKDTNQENRLYLRNGQFEQLNSGDPYQLRTVVENKTKGNG